MSSSLQQQFEDAFGRIVLDDSGKRLSDTEIVYGCVVNNDFAKITLILPEGSDFRNTLPGQVEQEVLKIPSVSRVAVEVVARAPEEESPAPQEAERPAQQPRRTAYLQNYDCVLAVASGKGGVGKSTVSINLALALQQKGFRVSLFDADIYGPSMPIMTGMRGAKPAVHGNKLHPIEAHGISLMSIGNLVEEDSSVVWRGPMVHSAIDQLLRDTEWPGGEFMIIDMPPGTGDAHLSLSQLCELAGAVVVSTPQDVALLDAAKAVNMFTKVDIPIVGIVENMSFFACPKCGEETPIFNRHGAEEASKQYQVPFLGAVPIELEVRQGGDAGTPVMAQGIDTAATRAFRAIADNVVASLEQLG
jgi:ATP-binding protein involved in chromosome partitioning